MVKEQKLSRDLRRIESKLKEVFQPVSPPAAFVSDLRMQLDQEMSKKITSKRVKNGLLLAGGVVGIAVMMVTLIRSLIALPGVVKSIIEKFPRLKKREQAASI